MENGSERSWEAEIPSGAGLKTCGESLQSELPGTEEGREKEKGREPVKDKNNNDSIY